MIALKDELYAMPMHEWRHVPYTVSRHKWWIKMYRFGDEDYEFCFESPQKRRYFFHTSHDGCVDGAEVALANGDTIADYREIWGDSPARLDAVLRLTPKHVLNRLFLLLDAIRF